MLTTSMYCLKVQRTVLAAKPDHDSPSFKTWFADTGKASIAVSDAVCGYAGRGIEVAERLAEKYGLADQPST